jgi:hypothetical protein
MPVYPRQTDDVHRIKLPTEIRCYWSEIETQNDEDVWMRVETYRVNDGTAVRCEIFRLEAGERVESLGEVEGTLTDNAFENLYHVQLTEEQMDAAEGEIALIFEASVGGTLLVAESQKLVIKRPDFSI